MDSNARNKELYVIRFEIDSTRSIVPAVGSACTFFPSLHCKSHEGSA